MRQLANGTSFTLGTVVGGLMGAAIALLCAPKSGKQLRKDIAKKYDDISENVHEAFEEGKEKLQEKFHKGKEAVDHVGEEGKNLAKHAKESIEDGKDKLKKSA